MTEYTLTCMYDAGDEFTATLEDGAIIFRGFESGSQRTNVFADAGAARAFARGILALTDEIDGGEATKSPESNKRPQVGDLVRVVRSAPGDRGRHEGDIGTLEIIDADDPGLAYRVRLSDSTTWWCMSVEAVDQPAATNPTNPRAGLVTQAQTLLADTDHTAADIIALARFLSEAA